MLTGKKKQKQKQKQKTQTNKKQSYDHLETILERINKVGRFMFSNLKTQYKATVIKTMWHWHKDRHEPVGSRNKPISLWLIDVIYKNQLKMDQQPEHRS